jgi:hypothetical protein
MRRKTFKIRSGLLFLAVLLIMLVMQGCQKDSDPDLTGKALITSLNWKISSLEGTYTVKLGNIPFLSDDFSLTDSLAPCEKDDYVRFFQDNTFEVVDGGIRCDGSPQDGIIDAGTYQYDEENNRFFIDILEDDLEDLPDDITIDPWFEVVELSPSRFSLSKSIDESFADNGVTYNVSADINLTMVPVNSN